MNTASSHLHSLPEVTTSWHRARVRAPRPRTRHTSLRHVLRRRPERLQPSDPLALPSEVVVRSLGIHQYRC